MGSFDFTCTISGLPIGAGDKVRYLLLTQNPYHHGKRAGDMTVYPTDVWFPRTFPLRGKYNDYGNVEDLQAGPQADAWIAGLNVDMVEKGWGDNTCHDVPTKKSMPLSDILEAVREGRVHVRRDVGSREGSLGKVPKGIPTRRRVEQALVKAGFPLSESYGKGTFVNRVDANTVRVRVGEYGERADRLTKIRDALAHRWAGAVCCGSGNYSDDAELLLRPLPGVHRRARPTEKREPALCVSRAMIREDVWQAICALPLKGAYDREAATVADGVTEAWAAWEKSVGADDGGPLGGDFRRFMMRHDAPYILDDCVPFTVGLGTHWWLMVDAFKAGKVDPAEHIDFLQTAGEFIHVQKWLGWTRFQWHAGTSTGPQCGEWDLHAKLLGAYQKIAADESFAEAARRGED